MFFIDNIITFNGTVYFHNLVNYFVQYLVFELCIFSILIDYSKLLFCYFFNIIDTLLLLTIEYLIWPI